MSNWFNPLMTESYRPQKEGEMKWQLIAVSCPSFREKHTGRVGEHPDTGIIALWLMGAGAFGIINFIYCVLSLLLCPLPITPYTPPHPLPVLCGGISATWWHTFNCTLIEDPAGMKKLLITFYDLVTVGVKQESRYFVVAHSPRCALDAECWGPNNKKQLKIDCFTPQRYTASC